jgi:hypothetical protein
MAAQLFETRVRAAYRSIGGLIVALLVIWSVVAVLGLVLKGLFWLFVVGAILFVATGVFGWVRQRA